MADLLQYQPSHGAIYYRPPKRFDLIRTAAGFVAALLIGALGSLAYAWILPKISSPLIRVGAVAVAAASVGYLGVIPVRFGKVRIPALASIMGSLISLFCLYVMWLGWIDHLVGRQLPYSRLILEPMTLTKVIRAAYNVGTWSYHGDIVRGPMLLIYWLGEAAAMVAAGVMIPMKKLATDDPICTQCGAVCKQTSKLPRFAADRQADFVAAVEARDFQAFAAFPGARNEDDPELSLRLLSCPVCRTTNVLTVNEIAWHINNQGQAKVKSTPLVDQLLVTTAEAAQIVTVCRAIRTARSEQAAK